MTALTANNKTWSRSIVPYAQSVTCQWPLADAVVIYSGALLGLSDDGYVGPLSTTYRYGFVGIADEDYDNTSGANAAYYLRIIQPPFISDLDSGLLSSVTYADQNIGQTVFCNTDNIADVTLTPDGVTDTPLGVIGTYVGAKVTNPGIVCSYAAPMCIGGLALQTMTGNVTLVALDAADTGELRVPTPPLNGMVVLNFDPGGSARTLTLPAAATAYARGIVTLMINNAADGAEILTVTDGTLSITPTQNEAAICMTDGAAWFGLVGARS